MLNELQTILKSLVIQYTSFVPGNDNIPWCTSVNKLELDIKQLLDEGYVSLSLEEAYLCRQGLYEWPKKAFCMCFWGGYSNNYTLAYPIIKKYDIKVSIFVTTDLMGVDKLDDIIGYEPHFGWNEAQAMVDSGLVSIYPLWHNMDAGKDFKKEILEKIALINRNVKNNDASFAIAFNNKELDCYTNAYLNQLGIKVRATNRYNLSLEDIRNGSFPAVRVEMDANVIDTLELFSAICESNIEEDESVYRSKEIYNEPDESFLKNNIELPIDPNPIVRNYLRHAVPLSVIQAERMDKAELYALSECIEVTFKPWYEWFDYHNYSYEYWESIEYRKITKDILDANDINIIHYIINGLKAGYYSDIWLDTYYIPNKPGYNKKHQTHGLLIYGFDAEKKLFLAISYTKSGHYQTFRVPPKAIALGCTNKYFVYLNLIKNNSISYGEYNINDICKKLSNYINSLFYDDNTRFIKKGPNQYYNYNACVKFAESIKETALNYKYIHIKMMYSYSEHKKLMAWRIKYIAEREGLNVPNIDILVKDFGKKTEQILNASMKYNITHSERTVIEIVHTIEYLNLKEKEMIEKLLYEIEKRDQQ